ncbi:DUF4911 domain-containing protein [Hypnocyclicus thermotrophus]|nr:DUF4911 domain-containing protein [Hypnocyclicus thermotrophus]
MYSYEFFIKTEKKHIDFINKIIEAYEGVGVVRTLNPKEGEIKIITLNYFIKDIEKILENLRNKGVKLEITKQGKWGGII